MKSYASLNEKQIDIKVGTWKEAVVDYFQILSQQTSGETEEKKVLSLMSIYI
jgi:hypothetical protein